MGMDVYGKAATDETGKYFRNNAWWWRPLAKYCCQVAPKITCQCEYWQSNDGDGLDAANATLLADALQTEIDAGRTLLYEKKHNGDLEMLPNEDCNLCQGTGVRKDMKVADGCNKCLGAGHVRPIQTWYPFSVENVQSFVDFLRTCGGFEIC